jgi:hypothetical protein
MSEKSILLSEVMRLRAALGCHIQADAYRDSFPDDEQDAACNRKSETWWRLMARCVVPQDDPLHEACSVAAMSIPEVAARRDAIIAKVAEKWGA